MRLLLIRHGQTPNNVTGALDTAEPGAGLTTLGHAQADALVDALADERIDAIYASPLIRTQLTAAPLAAARGVMPTIRPGLEEVAAGALEMRADAEAIGTYAERLTQWMTGNLGAAMPTGPDGHHFWDRFSSTLETITGAHAPDETVAVFTHGAAMRVFTAVATGMAAHDATHLTIANTGMAALVGERAAGWRLDRWHSDPLGGSELLDPQAHDTTGDDAAEVAEVATSPTTPG